MPCKLIKWLGARTVAMRKRRSRISEICSGKETRLARSPTKSSAVSTQSIAKESALDFDNEI